MLGSQAHPRRGPFLVVAQCDARFAAGVDALVHGASLRLRPILMTALLAVLGLLPMRLWPGIGSESAKPRAVGGNGGLVAVRRHRADDAVPAVDRRGEIGLSVHRGSFVPGATMKTKSTLGLLLF